MGFAQVCPICNGSGKVSVDYQDQWNHGSSKEKRDCHGCKGLGWIDVSLNYPFIPSYISPYVPYIPSQYPTWKWIQNDDGSWRYSNE